MISEENNAVAPRWPWHLRAPTGTESKEYIRSESPEQGVRAWIKPDYEVMQKAEDTAKGVDTVLQFTLDLIKKSTSKLSAAQEKDNSLPWLILTDKKHIIQAEGLSVTELNEKITILRQK